MTLFASLSGAPVLSAAVVIPFYGAWSADVMLADVDSVPAGITLTVGNLSLAGAVMRQSAFGGRRTLRLVGGAGGWSRPIAPRHYQHSFGVTRGMVIGDAAREVGETAIVTNDATLGTDYVRMRPGGGSLLAGDVLRLVGVDNWYVDTQGITQVSAWPTRSVATAFQVIDFDPSSGRAEIATEDYASWLPGATFVSPYTEGTLLNAGARLALDAEGRLRLDVMTEGQ